MKVGDFVRFREASKPLDFERGIGEVREINDSRNVIIVSVYWPFRRFSEFIHQKNLEVVP